MSHSERMEKLTVSTYAKLFALICHTCIASAFLVNDGLHRVNTQFGEIVGSLESVHFDGKTSQVARFLGIPFAEPPVGDLRFRKPVPVRSIPTPFAAHSYGPACIQRESGGIPGITFSEDCLYLNVFVPVNTGQSGLLPKPVMVWIHGGGLISGFPHVTEGSTLSAYTDVIVVTIQYRLGPLGFFSTHDQHARGNYGMWDQHTAIKWVRDNIGSFGGDMNNMTIFGESAGSYSVVYQTLYPGNNGLFKRAIAESGTAASWAITAQEINYNASLKFAEALGCDVSTHEKIMKCTRSRSPSEIKSAASKLGNFTQSFDPPKWVPVYDGEFVITDPTKILDRASDPKLNKTFSSFRNIDLIIGATNYDGAVLLSVLYGIFDVDVNITVDDLKRRYVPKLIPMIYQKHATDVSINAVLNEYRDYGGETNAMDALLKMTTDAVLNAPTMKTVKAHSIGESGHTYLYQFSIQPPMRILRLPSYIDGKPDVANHGDDLTYVFGFDQSMFQAFRNVNRNVSSADIKMSKLMMTMWSNFARSGNPNMPTSLRPLADVMWREFNKDDENYMEFTPNMTQQSSKTRLAARGVAFWNELLPSLLDIGQKVTSQ